MTPSHFRTLIIGAGQTGIGALNHMIGLSLAGVEFVSVSDINEGPTSTWAPVHIQLDGPAIAAGSLQALLGGADLVFVLASLGSQADVNLTLQAAHFARASGAFTICVAYQPALVALSSASTPVNDGLAQLTSHTDATVLLPVVDVLTAQGRPAGPSETADAVNAMFSQCVRAISDLVNVPGLIGLDVADLRSILADNGIARIAMGRARGNDRARAAAEQAISSPALPNTLDGAQSIVINITGGPNLDLFEVNEAASLIRAAVHPDSRVIFGAIQDDQVQDMTVTLVTTA